MVGKPWSLTANGVTLTIRLTPRGGHDAVDGIEAMSDGRAVLKVRVRAVPSEGGANAALVRLIAKTMGVPSRNVVVAAGSTGRLKRLVVSGDGPTLIAALEKIAASR